MTICSALVTVSGDLVWDIVRKSNLGRYIFGDWGLSLKNRARLSRSTAL